MRIFNVNFYKLTSLLLPAFLRQPLILAFLGAMVSPVVTLFAFFTTYRESNLYRLSVTPQVYSLQKMLNDRFDPSERRIVITDNVIYPSAYMYQVDELKPLALFQESENKPVYFFQSTETYPGASDFVVTVPAGLPFDANEMRAVIDMYKLPTKKYIINYE